MSASSAVLSAPVQRPHLLDVIADPVRLHILRALSHVNDASASELAEGSPASYQTLRRHLEALESSRVIESRPGVSYGESGRPATRFSLTPEVRSSVRSVFAV